MGIEDTAQVVVDLIPGLPEWMPSLLAACIICLIIIAILDSLSKK